MADGQLQLHPLQNMRHQGACARYQLANAAGRGRAQVFHDLTPRVKPFTIKEHVNIRSATSWYIFRFIVSFGKSCKGIDRSQAEN